MKVQPHSFLSSALDGGEWLTSRPGRFNPGKQPRYLLNRKLGGTQSRSGDFAEENDLLPLPGFPDRPARSLVATPSILPRLLSGNWNSPKWYCKTSVLTTHHTHFLSPASSKRLMLFLTILHIYYENHTQHTYTLYREPHSIINVTAGGKCSCHWVLNDTVATSLYKLSQF